MAGCISCGQPTPRRKCKDCELAERYEDDRDDLATDGGQPTGGCYFFAGPGDYPPPDVLEWRERS